MIKYLMSRISPPAQAVVFSLVIGLQDLFRRRPRPSSAPLVSGIAPGKEVTERPLSEIQLRHLQVWLSLHQEGWRRNVIPPAGSSYMVLVEHSDGTEMFLFLFSGRQSAICFQKHGVDRQFDHGWLYPPARETDDLIALLREET